MITLEAIGHTYYTDAGEEVAALAEVDLDIAEAEILVLVGPSGCGKSTLLRILAGFLAPTSGTLRAADGTEIQGPGTDRGVVFQHDNLYPWLSVRRNISLAAELTGQERQRERAEELLDIVGLAPAADRLPHELSGGMRQRAQIARVLAAEPPTVLMDEPFSALDPFTRRQLQAELLAIWSLSTPTIVLVTHSVEEAVVLADRVVVMGAGGVLSTMRVPAELRDRLRAPGADLSALATDPSAIALRERIEAQIRAAHG